MPSKDLLEKLFDVEHEAEAMVTEAREKAGRRLDEAGTSAQKYYAEAYDAALAKALAACEKSDKQAREDYEGAIANFRECLESSVQDKDAFVALCDAILEEGP